MTLNKKPANPILTPSRQFRFRGKQITITLIDPYVSPDGKTLTITAGFLWHGVGRLEDLTAPMDVHGWYVPATFKVEGFGFSMTFKTGFNNSKVQDADAIVITEIVFENPALPQQIEMILPLERLKIYAIQLSGVFATAYPPNYRQYYADGISYFDAGDTGSIEPMRYGYKMTRTSAFKMIGVSGRPERDLNDPLLETVAAAYLKYRAVSGHGIIQGIANEIGNGISDRQVKALLEECRKPSIGLLPPTGRKRKQSKTKPKKRGTK